MSSKSLTNYVIGALLIAFTLVNGYYKVCLRRIKLDSYWESSFSATAIDPYADIYVDGVYKMETDSESYQEVHYGSADYCIYLNANSKYKVQLMEYNYVSSDDAVCSLEDAITDYDKGWNYETCTDAYGYTNYADYYVTEYTPSPTPSPTNSHTEISTTSDLMLCKFILDNSENVHFEYIGNGDCNVKNGVTVFSYTYNYVGGTTTINDATCNWDGGDCCMATNPSLWNNDHCLDPRYSTTTTTYSNGSNGSNISQRGVTTIIAIVAVVVIIIVCIGGIMGFLYMKRRKSVQQMTSNLDYQMMDSIETANNGIPTRL